MKRYSEQSWQVELPCPQCGAPVVLQETEQIFSCSYCRVKHALACRDYFRYCLVPGIPNLPDVFYVPYWRYRGILFSCHGDGRIRHRVVDSSFRATAATFFPNSLGMRPQALRLQLITPATVGRFWKVNRRHVQAASEVEESNGLIDNSNSSDLLHSALVGETLSLIYSPVVARDDVLYDAVLDNPIVKLPGNMIGRLEASADRSDGFEPVKFIPTLCPQCGWDLKGDKDTLALFCSNCDSAWKFDIDGLTMLDFSISGGTEDADLLLPFWRFRAEMGGIELNTYAELVKLANLPRVVEGPVANRQFHFWVPAFKVNPKLFLRLARLMTLAQPEEGTAGRQANLPSYPVTLPGKEAVEAIHVLIADLAVPKRQVFLKLAQIRTSSVEQLLVYLPFAIRGNEVIHSEMQISLNRNALELGRLI